MAGDSQRSSVDQSSISIELMEESKNKLIINESLGLDDGLDQVSEIRQIQVHGGTELISERNLIDALQTQRKSIDVLLVKEDYASQDSSSLIQQVFDELKVPYHFAYCSEIHQVLQARLVDKSLNKDTILYKLVIFDIARPNRKTVRVAQEFLNIVNVMIESRSASKTPYMCCLTEFNEGRDDHDLMMSIISVMNKVYPR